MFPKGIVDVTLKGYDQPMPALPLTFDQIGSVVNELLAENLRPARPAQAAAPTGRWTSPSSSPSQ